MPALNAELAMAACGH